MNYRIGDRVSVKRPNGKTFIGTIERHSDYTPGGMCTEKCYLVRPDGMGGEINNFLERNLTLIERPDRRRENFAYIAAAAVLLIAVSGALYLAARAGLFD